MTTIIFPGQGSQFLEMSKDFYDNFKPAKETFEFIEDITKINIKQIIFQNPSDLLNQTQYTQLAIFCASISIFNTFKSECNLDKFQLKYMLGHSLGEYTALTAAGILSMSDCCKLLKIRGELMQNAYKPNESGMAALIGLDCKSVQDIINNEKIDLEIANDNSPMQIVISGKKDSIVKSEKIFKDKGVKRFVLLNVSAAFHSHFMLDAEIKMNKYINNVNFNKPLLSIISNYDAEISDDVNKISNNLSKQMSNRVRWVESIKNLKKHKEEKLIEIGPGKVLSGLVKRISNNFQIYNLEFVNDIEKINNEF